MAGRLLRSFSCRRQIPLCGTVARKDNVKFFGVFTINQRRRKMAKGFGNMMKQMQKIQQEMERIQEELANKTVEGTAGGGMVKVVANGKQEILEVKIDPEVVNKEDVEMLEDLIVAAVNQAREKAAELQAEDMAKLTGGLKIPGLPF
jgi:hypothetical protein